MKHKYIFLFILLLTIFMINGSEEIKNYKEVDKIQLKKEIKLFYEKNKKKEDYINYNHDKYYRINERECFNKDNIKKCFDDEILSNILKLEEFNIYGAIYDEDIKGFKFLYEHPKMKNYGDIEFQRFIGLKDSLDMSELKKIYNVIYEEENILYFKYKNFKFSDK